METYGAIELFLKSCKAKGLSSETIRWYRGILLKFCNLYPTIPDSPEDIDEFLVNCKAGDERRHGYYRAIRAFYGFLRKRYQISNIIEMVDPPRRKHKEPRPLMPDELNQLLIYPHKSKIKAGLLFLADTGARVGEAARIHPNDIIETPNGHIVKISGKTGSRLVPISLETYYALIKVLPFGYSTFRFRRLISLAFKDAHINGSGISLRHTFGTIWRGDELMLQQIMGHSHLSTTKIYRALRTDFMSEQHHKYSPLQTILPGSKTML